MKFVLRRWFNALQPVGVVVHKKATASAYLAPPLPPIEPQWEKLPESDEEFHERLRNPKFLVNLVTAEYHPGRPSVLCRLFCSRFKEGGDKSQPCCEYAMTGQFPKQGFCNDGFNLIEATVSQISDMIWRHWVQPESI